MIRPRFLYLLLVITSLSLPACESDDPAFLEDVLYVRRNGADMPAYIYGNGASNTFVILLHGGPGGSGLEYRFGQYAADLEERYAMVYLDQRGQGMAQGNYSVPDVTIDEMVEDVRALALTLRHKYGDNISLFLMGHSWGGTLGSAVMVTQDYQNLFRGWIEVDGAHDLPLVYSAGIRLFQTIGTQQIAAGNSVDFWQEILDSVNLMNPDPAFALDDDILYLNQKGFEAEGELNSAGVLNDSDFSGFDQQLTNSLVYNNALTAWWSGNITNGRLTEAGLEQYSATPLLNRITTPTLLLWGKYDFVVSPELGESALAQLGSTDKQLIIFDYSGHSPMDTEPDLFVTSVVSFVDRYR